MYLSIQQWGLVAACLMTFFASQVIAGLPMARTSPAGVAYVVGGVGEDERQAMRTAYKHYKLRVEVAEQGGAYTAGMRLALRDMQGKLLLDVLVDGPWLLVDLPSGSYQLLVTKEGRQFVQKISLGNEAQQHVVFIWPKGP
jgi:hypothetical protein